MNVGIRIASLWCLTLEECGKDKVKEVQNANFY